MISERVAVRGFEAVWRDVMPLLTPHFIRVFNASRVLSIDPWTAGAVPRQTDAPDFVAEVAMRLSGWAHAKQIPVATIKEGDAIVQELWIASESVVDRYEGATDGREHPFTRLDFEEARAIAGNIEAAVGCLPGAVEYSPAVRGAGVLGSCEADLSVGKCLIEVKAVDRRFAAKDLKQLLLYLALDAMDGRRWTKGCMLNPRRATWCRFEVEELVPLLSGGRAGAEVLLDLVDGMRRDVEADSAF